MEYFLSTELMKTRTSDQMEVITLGGKVEELEVGYSVISFFPCHSYLTTE